MTAQAEALKSAIAALSRDEQAEIAQFLFETISLNDDTNAIDEAWDDELMRRFELIKSGKAVGTPADEVFEKYRGNTT